MGFLDLFGGDSSNTTTNQTTSYSNSGNTYNSTVNSLSNVGNTTLSVTPQSPLNLLSSPGAIVAVAALGVGLLILTRD